MADLKKTIDVILNGEDKASRSFRSVNRSIGDLSGKVQGATQPLANMHDTVLKLEAALGLLAVGGLALSVRAFTEWQDQVGEIKTLLDETGQGVVDFSADIKSYAQDSASSIKDINSAIYSAISAGVDYQDSIESISEAEQLAIAGRANLDDSLKLVVSTLNAYGEESDQAAKYADVFFQTVKEGQTTIPELATTLSKVSGLAANAGIDIEELAAAIATLTAAGAPTSEAITGIRGAISNILKPTSQAQEAADKLGIEFGAAALKSKGFKAVLDEVYEATDGNTEEMTRFFGRVEALNSVLVLAGSNSDKFTGSLESMENSTGSVATAFEKMEENISHANQNLKNNVQLTLIGMGEEIERSYSDLVGSISETFKGLQVGLDEGAFDEVFEVINEAGGDLSKMLEEIAANLPDALEEVDFSGFATSIDDLLRSFGDLIQALFREDLSTTSGLANAIQKVTDGFQTLTEISAGIVEAWEPWFELLGDTLEKMSSFDTETNKAIGSTLQLGKVVNQISGIMGSLSGALEGVQVLMYTLTTKTFLDMVGGLRGIKGAVGSATTSLGGLQSATTKAIGTTAGKAGLLGLSYAAGHTVGTLINKYVPGVSKATQAVYGWVDSIIDFTDTQKHANTKAKAFERLVDALSNNMHKYKDDLSDIREELSGLGHDMEGVPDGKVIKMAAEADILSFDRVQQIVDTRIPAEKDVDVNVDDGGTAENTERKIKDMLPEGYDVGVRIEEDDSVEEIRQKLKKLDEEEKEVPVKVDDKGTVEVTKKNIEDNLPAEKKMAITPELQEEKFKKEIAKLEAQSEVAQTALEWEAKIEIKDLETQAEKMKALAEGVTDSFKNTGDVIGDLMGSYTDAGDTFQEYHIESWIEREQKRRDELLDTQRDLTQAEIDYTRAKTDALQSGDGQIQIEASGLEPELEAFMWKIIERVQIRANEEASEFLLGVG